MAFGAPLGDSIGFPPFKSEGALAPEATGRCAQPSGLAHVLACGPLLR